MTTSMAAISPKQMAEFISDTDLRGLSIAEVDAFKQYVAKSTILYAAFASGKLIGLCGLITPTLLSDRAYLWLQTTEAAQEHEFILVRQSQIAVKEMLKKYPTIVGHCAVGAERSIRWLKWLGAAFGEPEGEMLPFVIRKQ